MRVFDFYLYGDLTDDRVCTSRPKPYDRPSRPPAFATPNDQDTHPMTQTHTPRMNVDGPTLSRLFQSLAPLINETSSGFDSKATAICSTLGLDPTISEEIVGSFKKQFVANGSQDSRYVGESLSVAFAR